MFVDSYRFCVASRKKLGPNVLVSLFNSLPVLALGFSCGLIVLERYVAIMFVSLFFIFSLAWSVGDFRSDSYKLVILKEVVFLSLNVPWILLIKSRDG